MNFCPLSEWLPNFIGPLVIAGPCSAESEQQVIETAKQLKKNSNVQIFRAGVWKPRTRPQSFEGIGEKALDWLANVKKETGLLVSTEVANSRHVELALKKGIDVVWIGARTTTSPFAVQEIADALKGTDTPVLIKNPINADISLWIGGIERIREAGLKKVVAIHRGFSSSLDTKYRNSPLWRIPIELKQKFPDLPLICDPSHLTGKRLLIPELCQKAMDMDMDGLMVETHLDPDSALSDSAQQITPKKLEEILFGLKLRTEHTNDSLFEHELLALREKIDHIDSEIIEHLQMRKDVVRKIADAKKGKNITALQKGRMDTLFKTRQDLAEELGLSPEYIKDIFNFIHEESVKEQTEIFKSEI